MTSPAACSLIPPEEAGAALGGNPAPAESSEPRPGYSLCSYAVGVAHLEIYLVTVNGKAAYLHAHPKIAGDANSHIVDLSGIGDGAFGSFAQGSASVEFYKGDVLVAILLVVAANTASAASGGRSAAAMKDRAVTLARSAADQL